jgi:hypothetical protein
VAAPVRPQPAPIALHIVTWPSNRLCFAAALYIAALTAPFWMFGLWAAGHSGVAGFMRNTDSIPVAVIDTQSPQSWLLEPGQTVPMQRGLYRIAAGADALDFDPSDSVMASSLTWVVGRDGLRGRETASLFEWLPLSMGITIAVLEVAAAWRTAVDIADTRPPRARGRAPGAEMAAPWYPR